LSTDESTELNPPHWECDECPIRWRFRGAIRRPSAEILLGFHR
jgi:hypothetical protein